MAEKLPPDSFLRTLRTAQDRIGKLEATARRRLLVATSPGQVLVASTGYVDVGLFIANCAPSPAGRLLVTVTGGAYLVPPGEELILSYRLANSTGAPPIGADDAHGFRVGNGPGNTDGVTVYGSRESVADNLRNVGYDVILQARTVGGTGVILDTYGVTVQPC